MPAATRCSPSRCWTRCGSWGPTARWAAEQRDEEKARAKERIFSHRDTFGQWDPKHQRPELWSLYNGRRNPGEHFRVFPLSNWTELDVWQFIAREGIALPSLYFAHRRRVFEREGLLLAETPFVALGGGEVRGARCGFAPWGTPPAPRRSSRMRPA